LSCKTDPVPAHRAPLFLEERSEIRQRDTGAAGAVQKAYEEFAYRSIFLLHIAVPIGANCVEAFVQIQGKRLTLAETTRHNCENLLQSLIPVSYLFLRLLKTLLHDDESLEHRQRDGQFRNTTE